MYEAKKPFNHFEISDIKMKHNLKYISIYVYMCVYIYIYIHMYMYLHSYIMTEAQY
jgi:hypothetical protein